MPTFAESSLPQRTAQSPARVKPPVKWVGGKGRLCTALSGLLPAGAERMRHVEAFAGGAAFFFFRAPQRAVLLDVNEALIETYRAIRDSVEDVIQDLRPLAEVHTTESYYAVRRLYNEEGTGSGSLHAARFIYLNKTCFNGLHRVNSSGAFNVPAGRYKSPRIVDPEGLREVSRALQGVRLEARSYCSLLDWAQPGDFVYLDPPYAPVSSTSNFTSYAASRFLEEDQRELRDVYRALDRRGCKLMLSNSDQTSIRELYQGFDVTQVWAPRLVNCNARKRGAVAEVVVRNYRSRVERTTRARVPQGLMPS